MSELTQAGREALAVIANRHGVSLEAVDHMLIALIAGQGTQAQFNHPDFGGMGQWSMGGMIMVGDMFNNGLKARVDAICNEVAQLMQQSTPLHLPSALSTQTQSQGDGVSLFVSGRASGSWWPGDLGHAASTGAQNRMRYAWFPETRRLAIDAGNGSVKVYDTADHRIGGFSQQQSGDQSLSFTSQHGLVKLSELREVTADSSTVSLSEAMAPEVAAEIRAEDTLPAQPTPVAPSPAKPETEQSAGPAASQTAEEIDIFDKIERLAALHAKGILTDSEYQSKKAEMLARI